MDAQLHKHWEQFQQLVRKIISYNEALGLLYWDLRTGAPRKGTDIRSETIGILSTEGFKLQVSEEMGQLLAIFAEPQNEQQLDERSRRMVAEVRKNYEQSQSIPPEKFQEYTILSSQSEVKWEEAKENSDFAGFEPYLSRIVALKQEFIDYWG